jgi:hypothetical protein
LFFSIRHHKAGPKKAPPTKKPQESSFNFNQGSKTLVAPLLKQASPFFLSAPRSLAPGHGGGNQLQNSDFYPKL